MEYFYKNNITRWKNLIGNLPLDPGKYAVNVQWYNQRDIGSSLEYTIDRTNPYPIVNHNHTLVLGGQYSQSNVTKDDPISE
jgi:hypothetical protein